MTPQIYKVFDNHRIVLLTDHPVDRHFIPDSKVMEYATRPGLYAELDAFYSQPGVLQALIISAHSVQMLFSVFSDYFTIIHAAGGMVWNEADELLVIKRLGYSDLPKGKCEPGEHPSQAALREVTEETGLTNLTINRFIQYTYHTYKTKKSHILKINYWFEMRYDGHEKPVPQTDEDITEASWIKRTQLSQVSTDTYASLKELFEQFKI